MVTEGVERFEKIVDVCGLYVTEEGKKILHDEERMKDTPVEAYVNEDAYRNHDGHILGDVSVLRIVDFCVNYRHHPGFCSQETCQESNHCK